MFSSSCLLSASPFAVFVAMEVEVLLEYKESKRAIKCLPNQLVDRILDAICGLDHATIGFADQPSSEHSLILQRFSPNSQGILSDIWQIWE